MGLVKEFYEYLDTSSTGSRFPSKLGMDGGYINFCNSGQRGGVKTFTLSINSFRTILENIKENLVDFAEAQNYVERTWRDLGARIYSDQPASALATVQTKPLFVTLSRIINWANGNEPGNDNNIDLSEGSLATAINKLTQVMEEYTPPSCDPSPVIDVELDGVVQSFEKNLSENGFLFKPLFPNAHIAASLSKKFLILTGLSGSGKTQMALALAKWISARAQQYKVIAIGADWTNNENLLGYPDALKDNSYRKPDNGVLDLILYAAADSENPYFLILDEMNLSHVERYFSDFLSAMESGEPITLHDDTGEDWDGVPATLMIPKNLFVIGTVNIDETTYMFSPKVLDRANVIEFRVDDDEMKEFLVNPVKPDLDAIAGKGSPYARSFVTGAGIKNVVLDEEDKKNVSDILMKFFPALKELGAEFGYRSANEICRFIYFYKELRGADFDFDTAMDAAIMQKLLPKLHGSKKKLMPVLEKLMVLCKIDPNTPESDTRFKVSLEKIDRMKKRLIDHGFASFAEA